MLAKIFIPTRFREIEKDYRLPIMATCVFIFLLVFVFGLRLHERSVIGQVLSENSATGHDYATLLSRDKVEDLKKDEIAVADPAAGNGASTATSKSSTTFKTGPSASASPSAPTSSGSGAATTTPSTGVTTPASGGATPSPAQPFSASIVNFRQEATATITCTNGSGSKEDRCSKNYFFGADIHTSNGPGVVKLAWSYSVNGSTTGSFTAASGEASMPVHTQLTIPCNQATIYTAQLTLTSPTQTQSPALRIVHYCNL